MATLILADGHRYNTYVMKVDLCFKKSAVEAAMYPEENRYMRVEFKGGVAQVPDKPDILEAIENSDEFKREIVAYVPTVDEIKVNEAELLKKEREENLQKILEIDRKLEEINSVKDNSLDKEKSKKTSEAKSKDKPETSA